MPRRETANYTREIPEYGDLMTIQDYLESVENGSFIDYDGHGNVVRDGLMEERSTVDRYGDNHINPSDGDSKIPLDATHVIWFNR